MKTKGIVACVALCLMGVPAAYADNAPAAAPAAPAAATPAAAGAGQLGLELNKAETADNTCKVTFVIRNRTTTEIESSSYIMSLFDPSGQIIKPVNLKFPPFPVGRIKVIQFPLDLTCDKMGSIVPEVTECKAADGTDSTACDNAATTSKTTISFSSDIQ